MKRSILLGLPLLLITPLLVLVMGMGNASIEAVRSACANAAASTITSTITSTVSDGSFRIGTLNWRGASHYKKNPHPGERPYSERVPNMVAKIGASGASIAGFQEFEPPQAQAFLDTTGGQWSIVRGRAHGQPDTRDAIAYQTSAWTVAETRYITINYAGNPIDIPLVRFTSTSASATSFGSIWVLNTHNPADAVNGSDAMRDSAVRAAATALGQLQTSDPSTPLFLIGDMNDRARFKELFLTLAGAGWSAANPTDEQIDWIIGGPGVSFSRTVVDKSTNDNAHSYTDHPFVHTAVQLAGSATDPRSSVQGSTGQEASGQGSAGPGAVGPGRTEQSRAGTDLGEEPTTTPLVDTTSTGCPLCPTTGALSVALPDIPGTGTLRDAQVAAAAAHQAGFRGEDLVTAVAIAGVESTWNPRAANGSHYGLWQIAARHQGMVPGWNAPADIFDPLLNATYAHALYQARRGSGRAKFADWLPFETQDYHQYLDLARQAVATIGIADLTHLADTSCTASATAIVGQLSSELSARVNAMLNTTNGLCALSWTHGAPCTYDNQCPKVVDALYGGPGVGRGYGNGQDVAQGIINAGLDQAHGTGLDTPPPVGAVVSYNTGNGTGHVAIYVGDGKIFGNDYGCSANGVYGCVGFADIHAPGGSVTWALPQQAFDLGGMPSSAG